MAERGRCSYCGAAMQASAVQGLCPACLQRQGLESEGTDRRTITPPIALNLDAVKSFEPNAGLEGILSIFGMSLSNSRITVVRMSIGQLSPR